MLYPAYNFNQIILEGKNGLPKKTQRTEKTGFKKEKSQEKK